MGFLNRHEYYPRHIMWSQIIYFFKNLYRTNIVIRVSQDNTNFCRKLSAKVLSHGKQVRKNHARITTFYTYKRLMYVCLSDHNGTQSSRVYTSDMWLLIIIRRIQIFSTKSRQKVDKLSNYDLVYVVTNYHLFRQSLQYCRQMSTSSINSFIALKQTS